MRALRAHIAALPPGPIKDSIYLFPSIAGGMRSRSALDKPFRAVTKAIGWTLKLAPKCMRRTFNDLARQGNVHDIVLRSISGHLMEAMQERYSTAQQDERRTAVGKVIEFATARRLRTQHAARL